MITWKAEPSTWLLGLWDVYDEDGNRVVKHTTRDIALLVANTPDYALTLAALISGKARWEPLGDGQEGEICVSGLRYVLELDEAGCPALTEQARTALAQA